MNTKLAVAVILAALATGFCLGRVLRPVRVVEVEIAPEPVDNQIAFYVDYLASLNYTVTPQNCRVMDYELVTMNELLWLLETANATECFVDYGSEPMWGVFLGVRPKIWFAFDGTYWQWRPPR
jgi:hypothetical protein